MRGFWAMVAVLLVFGWAGEPARAAKVDFAKDIWPLFKEHCIKCHGAKKQKGKLALHTPEAIMAGAGRPGRKEPVVVKGNVAKSWLYERVMLPEDDDDVMPPDDAQKLTKAQQDLIKTWIEQGASFGEWKGQKARPKALIETLSAPEADAGALKVLEEMGVLALPISQDSNLLNIDFRGVADKTDNTSLKKLLPLKQQVAWLNLAKTKITDSGLATLAQMPNLNQLHLEKTSIGNAGLAHLKGADNLEYLNLYGTQVSDAGLAHLAGLKNLKKLFVWQSKVTKEGAKKFSATHKVYVNNGWDGPAPVKPNAKAGGGPDIGQIMKKAHKSKLLEKVLKGQANKNQQQELVKLYEQLAKAKAPKGNQKKFAEATMNMLNLAKKVAKGDRSPKTLGQLKTAANCKACHSKHKP
ncbi:MAG: c-type cytochrome domain-containing protein [Phycisphaeraceae bacterium]|nr:c-type cytochrome domain-containing protein [Phycisphaeraceae bacterium]